MDSDEEQLVYHFIYNSIEYYCNYNAYLTFSVAMESDEERPIYHPQSISPVVTSCDDQSALDSIRQYFIDVLTQSGDLAAYCHKYPAECRPENVDVTCG